MIPSPETPETPNTPARQIQQLRDVRDLTDQILGQLDRVERQAPLAALLIRIKWGLQDLPSDLDTYVDRLEHAAARSMSLREREILPEVDLAQFICDLLDLADWLDHLEDLG